MLLYIKRASCTVPFSESCQLRAPDGHPIPWGEWSMIEGRVTATSIERGTHVVTHISHAIPNGVYTLWFNGLPLGVDDDPEITVTVSQAGEGQLSLIDPAGCAPSGSLLILAYHNDGQTHGSVPGAANTWVGQLFRSLP